MRSIVFGKVLGISLELHSSFVLLIVLVALALAAFFPQNFFGSIMLLFFLFASVFLHELTHSMVAVSKGYKVEKIILLPIGGIAVTSDLPEKPSHEFLIAVSGPLFNFFVVAVISTLAAFSIVSFPENWLGLLLSNEEAFEQALLSNPLLALFYVNLMLGSFNLFFPALPLDGGRVLRAVIGFFTSFEMATRIVSRLSVYLSILLFLIGFLFGNILLAIIALFVFFGSQQEKELAEIKAVLSGTKIKEIIEKETPILEPGLSLQEVFEKMLQSNKTEFLVKKDEGIGVITLTDLESTGKKNWWREKAGATARIAPKISESEDAARAFQKIIAKGYPFLPVFKGKEFVGVVRAKSLEKLYALKRLERPS